MVMNADPSDKASAAIEEIAIDAIEPDPAQPRRAFDEEKLQALAASIQRHGLLQEPGVIAVDAGGGAPARYRLVWGERRWRACALAGLRTVRCRVLPRGGEGTDHDLRLKDQQWAENMERENLSPVEEAIAIRDAVELRRRGDPSTAEGDLAEQVGAERGLNGTVARQLLGLLKAPRSLQKAMLDRTIGREVGFELARYWNKLVAQDEEQWALRREIQFRNLVLAWAAARGLELDSSAMARYAAVTFQDPKVVKATCQKAEQVGRKLVERFDAVVARGVRERWTVARAKSRLRDRERSAEPSAPVPEPLFERAGQGGDARVVVHVGRLHDPAWAKDPSLPELLAILAPLAREVAALLPEPAAGPVSPAPPTTPEPLSLWPDDGHEREKGTRRSHDDGSTGGK
jgi:ParB family chromosome partitioning protein